MDNVRTRFIGRREATAYFPNTSYSTQIFVQPPSIEVVPAPKKNVRNYSYGKTQVICRVFFSYHDNDQDEDLQKDKYKDTHTDRDKYKVLFSGVDIFRGEYLSGWIFFRGEYFFMSEYFSGVNLF